MNEIISHFDLFLYFNSPRRPPTGGLCPSLHEATLYT